MKAQPKMMQMMTAKDNKKCFKILLLSPHTLTRLEIAVLWDIARYEDKITYAVNNKCASNLDIFVWPDNNINNIIVIPRYIINALEHRGILKRRRYIPKHKYEDIKFYTWAIVWKKVKSFGQQTKELRVQKALGCL